MYKVVYLYLNQVICVLSGYCLGIVSSLDPVQYIYLECKQRLEWTKMNTKKYKIKSVFLIYKVPSPFCPCLLDLLDKDHLSACVEPKTEVISFKSRNTDYYWCHNFGRKTNLDK